MTSQTSNYILNKVFRIEDKIVRTFKNLPTQNRINSYPFLSSDTYFFQSDIRIDREEDLCTIEGGVEDSIVYLNGTLSESVVSCLIDVLKSRRLIFARLIIGDSDFPFEESLLLELKLFFSEIYCVNYRQETNDFVKNLPLGLESQRYRSAGQMRDFKKIPSFEPLMRPYGILVAWNDETFVSERKEAREVLRNLPFVYEFGNRVPARMIHRIMRKSKLIACPRGNGVDTHRFWESLYLGAVPVVLREHRLKNQDEWPLLEIDSWQQISSWNAPYLTHIYKSKVKQLREFREIAHQFVDSLGGKNV